MTKEAKIGMLTGLAVIVVIGVMLSEYLGNGTGPAGTVLKPGASSVATGRMAELPIGQTLRDQVMQPVGVPAMVRSDGPDSGAGGPIPTIPTAYAAEPLNVGTAAAPTNTGPTVSQPVTAIAAGPVQVASADTAMPATLSLDNTSDVSLQTQAQPAPTGAAGIIAATPTASGKPAAKPPVAKIPVKEYVIVKNDTLGIIAKKMYGTSSPAAQARLTDANPSLLKDGQPHVLTGAKIIVPNAPVVATAKPAPSPTALTKVDTKTADQPLIIHPPGTAKPLTKSPTDSKSIADAKPTTTSKTTTAKSPDTKTADAKSTVKKPDTKAYVVKPGDTLEKIAKRIGGDNPQGALNKIVAANGIKDPNALQPGETLKLPM